ncbi:MAG: PEP-CTERM sorting domain-containing protein [Chthonomonadaceae bacterium]|nr:PEP-CTERM sorting domain-containing protein [Chthonomonadaceae bacterium]
MKHATVSISAYRRRALALAVASAVSGSAIAQVNPPSWWNQIPNDESTISLGFAFDTNAFPPVASIRNVPTWFPAGAGTWTKSSGLSYFAGPFGAHSGAWGGIGSGASGGSMDVTIPNQFSASNVKHVWLQFDYLISGPNTIGVSIDGPPGSTFSNAVTTYDVLENVVGVGDWVRSTTSFDITPQPSWESIRWNVGTGPFGGVALVDNIFIGTHCEPVPEPASMTLAAFALCAAFRKRRGSNRVS